MAIGTCCGHGRIYVFVLLIVAFLAAKVDRLLKARQLFLLHVVHPAQVAVCTAAQIILGVELGVAAGAFPVLRFLMLLDSIRPGDPYQFSGSFQPHGDDRLVAGITRAIISRGFGLGILVVTAHAIMRGVAAVLIQEDLARVRSVIPLDGPVKT